MKISKKLLSTVLCVGILSATACNGEALKLYASTVNNDGIMITKGLFFKTTSSCTPSMAIATYTAIATLLLDTIAVFIIAGLSTGLSTGLSILVNKTILKKKKSYAPLLS